MDMMNIETNCARPCSPRHAEYVVRSERVQEYVLTLRTDRLRHHAQPHALRLHAEPLQSALPRGGARDVPDAQGKPRLMRTVVECISRRVISQLFGVGSIPWSPLGRGLLTRTVRDATTRGKTDLFSASYDMPFLDTLTSR